MITTSLPRIHADQHGLRHKELSEKLIGIFFDIYNELGHGFLESVYEEAFSVELADAGIFFQRQLALPVWFRGRRIGEFRADLVVENKIIIELKTGSRIDLQWEKQTLNYRRCTEIEVALLLNFGPSPEFKRYASSNERKRIRVNPRESAEKKL